MAKNAYIGVGGTARKIKDIYIGVNGVARKVTKAYVGVGNVARLFYEAVNMGIWPKYIYFNANNGSGTPSTVTFSSQSYTTDIGSTVPTRIYYTFCGWGISSSTSSSSSYRIAYNGNEGATTTSSSWNWEKYCEKVNQTDVSVTSITLYAVWKSSLTWPKYIYFNANNGSGSVPSTITFSSETSAYDTSSTRPTRNNYTFYGWALSSSATSSSKRVDYNGQQGATITGTWTWTTWCEKVGQSDATVSSITLYAVWVYSGSTTKTISKYSSPSISYRKFWSTGNNIGSYALFGPDASQSYLEYFNSSLSKSTSSAGWSARSYTTGKIGNYMMFISGMSTTSDLTSAYAYDSSLTVTNKSIPGAKSYASCGNIGSYLLIVGGASSSTALSTTAYTFNSSLTQGTATALSISRDQSMYGNIGTSYFVIAGGRLYGSSMSYSTTVDYYNSSLTRSTASSGLSTGLSSGAGGSIGDYFISAGGVDSSSVYSTIFYYNSSFTRGAKTMSYMRRAIEGAYKLEKLGDYLIIPGGSTVTGNGASSVNSTVETLNTSLTLSTITSMSVARMYFASAVVGDYAIYAGGSYRDSSNTTVYNYTADVYKLS